MIESVKLIKNGYLVNGELVVMIAPDNRHYQMVQAWIAAGNTPEAADEPSLAQVKVEETQAVDAWAAAERAKWRTPNMPETYAQKQRDVDEWNRIEGSGGTATVADVPYAARRAARKNGLGPEQLDQVTPAMLATVIGEYTAAIEFLRVKDLDIEDAREAAKEAIAAAATVAEARAVRAALTAS